MGYDEINIEATEATEADGYITRETDLTRPLERKTDNTASPSTECIFPRCEECSKYVAYEDHGYCTVPIVVSKQMWMDIAVTLEDFDRRITGLEEVIPL